MQEAAAGQHLASAANSPTTQGSYPADRRNRPSPLPITRADAARASQVDEAADHPVLARGVTLRVWPERPVGRRFVRLAGVAAADGWLAMAVVTAFAGGEASPACPVEPVRRGSSRVGFGVGKDPDPSRPSL